MPKNVLYTSRQVAINLTNKGDMAGAPATGGAALRFRFLIERTTSSVITAGSTLKSFSDFIVCLGMFELESGQLQANINLRECKDTKST